MPFLLRVAMSIGAVFGSLGTVTGGWALLRVATYDGPFRIGEVAVSRADFLAVAVPFLIIYVLACLTAAAASWALWRRRARSRSLLVALLAEFAVGDAAMLVFMSQTLEVSPSELASAALSFTVLVALGLWYLFRKGSVVRYYESISHAFLESASGT